MKLSVDRLLSFFEFLIGSRPNVSKLAHINIENICWAKHNNAVIEYKRDHIQRG